DSEMRSRAPSRALDSVARRRVGDITQVRDHAAPERNAPAILAADAAEPAAAGMPDHHLEVTGRRIVQDKSPVLVGGGEARMNEDTEVADHPRMDHAVQQHGHAMGDEPVDLELLLGRQSNGAARIGLRRAMVPRSEYDRVVILDDDALPLANSQHAR